jgi:co-chaperonin GroES (HSP10)
MLESPVDFLIVKLDKAFQDEIQTESGVKLYKDTHFQPEWNTTCIGKVISVPHKLSKRHDLRGLDIEPKAGDEIIFSYMVVYDMDLQDKDTPIHHNLFYHEGEYYWKVDYYHYLGRIIEGKIIPAQGYLFCEKEQPKQEQRIGLIWVPEMSQKKTPEGTGMVTGVGKPRKGEPDLSIEEGDSVAYHEKYACKYDILGKTYMILDQNRVMAAQNA